MTSPIVRRAELWVVLACLFAAATPAVAQDRGNPVGEWRYWGADAWNSRYSPLDQIDRDNFSDLEVAWTWRGDNYGPTVDWVWFINPDLDPGEEGPPYPFSVADLTVLFADCYEVVEDYVPDVAFSGREGRERVRVLRRTA
jgi:hypothetical protein